MAELFLDSDSDDSDLNIDLADDDDEYEPPFKKPLSNSSDSEAEEQESRPITTDVGTGTSDVANNSASHLPNPSLGRVRRERKDYVLNQLGLEEKNWVISSDRTPTVHPFTADNKMLVDASESTPLGYFKLFFDDFIISHIVDQTNKYAADFIRSPPKQVERKFSSK